MSNKQGIYNPEWCEEFNELTNANYTGKTVEAVVKASKIWWDTSDEELGDDEAMKIARDLPTERTYTIEVEDTYDGWQDASDLVCDKLSDEFGFCIYNFVFEVLSVNGKEVK